MTQIQFFSGSVDTETQFLQSGLTHLICDLKFDRYLITAHATTVTTVCFFLTSMVSHIILHWAGAEEEETMEDCLCHTAAAEGCPSCHPIEPDCQTLSDRDSLPTYCDSAVRGRQQRSWNGALDMLRFERTVTPLDPPHHSPFVGQTVIPKTNSHFSKMTIKSPKQKHLANYNAEWHHWTFLWWSFCYTAMSSCFPKGLSPVYDVFMPPR